MERGEQNERATFHNHHTVKNQAGRQVFHGPVFFGNDQHQTYLDGLSFIDRNVLESLAFTGMLDRRSAVEEHPCNWILELDEYKSWKDRPRGLLWIKGKPGAGKSTVMAFLHQRLKEQHRTEQGIVLEFFFSARGTELQRTPLGMLRSLLNQLYRQAPIIRPNVCEIYQEKCTPFGSGERNWQWQRPELEGLLQNAIVTSAQQQLVTIFVDALDEAGTQFSPQVVRYFHQINDCIASVTASGKICISCRHYPVVANGPGVEIWVEDHNSSDISTFIHRGLGSVPLSAIDLIQQEAWQALKEGLVRSAKGVFQWVRLIVPLVERKINDGESPEEIRHGLNHVPDELGGVYRYILQNIIEREHYSQSFLLFQWVCLAESSLSVAEMRYAMAARDAVTSLPRIRCQDTRNFVKKNELMERRVKALSGGLAEVALGGNGREKIIQVIHQSVTDFLLQQGLTLLATLERQGQVSTYQSVIMECNSDSIVRQCQATLYRSCLHYLATELVQLNEYFFFNSKDVVKNWLLLYSPWLEYATLNIFLHAEKATANRFGELSEEILLLQEVLPKWILAYRLMAPYSTRHLNTDVTLLHVASAFKLTNIVKRLVLDNDNVDKRDSGGDTPMHYAARWGHEEVAEILFLGGADMQDKNRNKETPLSLAAAYGNLPLVNWLLCKEVKINGSTGHSENALQAAARSGNATIVQMLIAVGAEVNTGGGNALHEASLRGYEKIVQMLLNAGAEVNAQGGEYGLALVAAAYSQEENIVRILLDAGADINAQGGEYGNALQAASHRGNKEIVQILLDAGADINVQGGSYGSALQAASSQRNKRMVQMLLDAGADVNAQGGEYGSALQAASYQSDEKIVQILLDAGADINTQGGLCGSALQAALHQDNNDILQMLLDARADVNAQNGLYGNALQVASYKGRKEKVQMLLDAGADINAKGGYYGTALMTAIMMSREDVIQLLLDYDADLSISDNSGQTPVHVALRRGVHSTIIDCLKKYPDYVNLPDLFGRTPLHVAVCYGRLDSVVSLLEQCANPFVLDAYGKSALDWASNDQAMFDQMQKYHPTFTPTSNQIQIATLEQSVRRLSESLLKTAQRWSSPGFHELGHCLMFLGNCDDARYSFANQVRPLETPNDGWFGVYCHDCDFDILFPSRFVCKVCADVNLCSKCMEKYPYKERLQACQNHEFLEVLLPDPLLYGLEITEAIPENVQEWLRGLIIRFGEKNNQESESSMRKQSTRATINKDRKGTIGIVQHSGMTPGLLIVIPSLFLLFRFLARSQDGK